MTNRVSSFLVVLEADIREDDAAPILDAIRQIRGVLSVQAVQSDFTTQIATTRVRAELGQKLYAALQEDE